MWAPIHIVNTETKMWAPYHIVNIETFILDDAAWGQGFFGILPSVTHVKLLLE